MNANRPTRFQIAAFAKALKEANEAPQFTDEHLKFLAARRDAFFSQLAAR